ncbi:BTB/POZ domain-containing protein 17 [Amia ocellicauda]|uniref:BTB/POZ domain-containing protein 17 n=1 Tax=Amia ocellicauda TaxID=2972642 RepID=UPI003463EB20
MDPRQSGPCEQVDHLQQLRALLSSLYNSQDLSDLLIMVNGSLSVHCHRLLLAAQSSVFKTMLSSRRWPEAQQQTISLTEEEQCLPYFEDFLRYFYSGALTLSTDNALPVGMLADKYNVVSLKKCCEEFMVKNVATPGKCNRAIQWRQYAKLADLAELKEACDRFIAWNMDTVICSPVWRSIDSAYLCDLLQRSDLVVESEMTLLKAAVDWLDEHPDQCSNMLQHIRYPMIQASQLFQYNASHTAEKPVNLYIQSKSLLIYQANSVPLDILKSSYDINSPQFSMRFYKSINNGNTWEISRYQSQQKIEHQIKFTTRLLEAECNWSLKIYPKGERVTVQEPQYSAVKSYYNQSLCYVERVVKDTDDVAIAWTVENCRMTQSPHKHRLIVLLQKFHNGEFFVTDVRDTFDSVPGCEYKIEDLIPESELQQYVSSDTLRLHFIGQTVWEVD